MIFILTENIPRVMNLLNLLLPIHSVKQNAVGASIVIYSYIGFITMIAYTKIQDRNNYYAPAKPSVKKSSQDFLFYNYQYVYLMLITFILGSVEISFYLYKKITGKKTFLESFFDVNISFVGHSVGYLSGILVGLIYLAIKRIKQN